jgi:hypothetical protein
MWYLRWKEVLWDPLRDPRDEQDARIPSQAIKLCIWGMVVTALLITAVLVATFLTDGPKGLSAIGFAATLAVLWATFLLLSLGLFLGHPYYRRQLRDGIQCRRCRGHANPLKLDDDDDGDYVETINLND